MKEDILMKALADCIEACGICASSCLNEKGVEKMRECIATDLDCADICSATLKVVSRRSSQAESLIKVCIEICDRCESVCSSHDMEHCQQCAKACKSCKQECESYLSVSSN